MYDFLPANTEILEATKGNWLDYLNNEDPPFSPTGYISFLSYLEDILNGGPSHRDTEVYVVKRNTEDFASAFFVTTYALPKTPDAWIKVLACRTSPRLDSRWDDTQAIPLMERLQKLSKILVEGLFGVYAVSEHEKPCKKIKIWANKQLDRDLFVRFIEELERNPGTSEEKNSISATMDNHGSWLVLDKYTP